MLVALLYTNPNQSILLGYINNNEYLRLFDISHPHSSHLLFATIFSSLLFQAEMENDMMSHPKLKNFKQRKREIQCAMNLAAKLQSYIDSGGDAVLFRQTGDMCSQYPHNTFSIPSQYSLSILTSNV